MATAASTLITRTRRFLRDYPEFDALTASVSNSGTTLTVADATLYGVGWDIQIEDECMLVKAASGTSVTVKRGTKGTTAVLHANGTSILARPRFLNVEILDAINAAIGAAFPYLYRPVATEWAGIEETCFEYLIPNMSGIATPIPYIYGIEYQPSDTEEFYNVRNFRIVRSEYPILKFPGGLPAGGRLRIKGYGPFTPLTVSTSLDSYFPVNAEDLIVWFAAQYLLASGEAGRVRVDTGAIDNREQANRVGSSMGASNTLYQRFQIRLRDAGMAPMPRHVVSVF